MKTVTLLIGPQGAGKSTYAKSKVDSFYINQDSQGKENHIIQYKNALTENHPNIIIDRTNFSKNQRMFYVQLAKEHGYFVKYHLLSESYLTCLKRIINREGHETIKYGDIETAKKALNMYFENFEYPDKREGYDIFTSPNLIHGQVQNVVHFGRTIIIGDVHGCYDELMSLLFKVNYDKNADLIIFAGDLCDRGPKSREVIDFALSSNSIVVMGNHDDKFKRYLKGNKVHLDSLKATLESFSLKQYRNEDYYIKFMDFPYVVCLNGKNYVSHAGFNPNKDNPFNNTKEFSIYARYFNPVINTFSRDAINGYWYEHMTKKDDSKYFFGHIVHKDFKIVNNTYPLDGGACFGLNLRCAIINYGSDDVEIVEVPSHQPKVDIDSAESKEWDHMNKFEPYDKLVELGYLRKQESQDLVLYNYTEKTTYDKFWNKYTMECRGLILDKNTGDTVARPFPKFFNLGEHENKELPRIPYSESYTVYEKIDGSLGILYYHPNEQKWKIATRGSFESDQAKKGTEMFHQYRFNLAEKDSLKSYNEQWEGILKDYPSFKDYTLLFEIIYPENRVNDGARLVCDYGTSENLIFLGGINKITGQDLTDEQIEILNVFLWTPHAKKYKYSIEQLNEMRKTLPMTEEGWVIKFKSGMRIKIKGDEYCKMQKILNSINPLSIWEVMVEANSCVLPKKYKEAIPEEIIDEVNKIESKLQETYEKIKSEALVEYNQALLYAKANFPNQIPKGLGLYAQTKAVHKSFIFIYHNKSKEDVIKWLLKNIRPNGNEFK